MWVRVIAGVDVSEAEEVKEGLMEAELEAEEDAVAVGGELAAGLSLGEDDVEGVSEGELVPVGV